MLFRTVLVLFCCISLLSACQNNPASPADSASSEPYPSTKKTVNAANNAAEMTSSASEPQSNESTDATVPKANANIWQRIKDGFELPLSKHPRTEAQLNWYLNHPSYMERVCERARPFLFDIVEVLDQRNMPMELALLPIVESAFQSYAYSHGQAAGLWQFIPSTGQQMGLDQNWWYDGRRDPYAATRAAADYLQRLNNMLDGDWLHSLAAYNAGPGNVRKAIRRNERRNRPTDFWSLSLPRETRAYVPKLLALQRLVDNADQYGITLCDIPNEPAVQRVEIKDQLDLTIAAELAAMSVDDIYQLNPGFNRWATAPNGPHYLLLPQDRAEHFLAAEQSLPDSQRLRWRQHVVKSGDTISEIAQRYHTTSHEIRQNNGLRGNTIRVGQRLRIPTAAAEKQQYTLSSQQQQAKRLSNPQHQTYRVRSGDSWWTISRRFNVSTRELARWNGKSPLDTLHVGQKVVIKKSQPSASAVASSRLPLQKVYYPVRRGDSFSTIASKFNVALSQLRRWNPTANRQKYLQPGQKLLIYVDVTKQANRR
ncbi:lytic murein transglycosylase C, membrane-bound [gamma proteobacterium HTCC5015]|nr:lytic murein transglycosylase C, membrane-bound [gamma proteobacterium HTCC5015]